MAASFKRLRGRPRIENPANRRGAARGARQGTIDLAKQLCLEAGRDFGDELERKLQELIEELAGVDALRQIVREMEAEQLSKRQRIDCLKAKIEELERLQEAGPPDGLSFEEAFQHVVDRLSTGEAMADYLGMLTPNAHRLAWDYPGHHWQTIKHALRKSIEERLRDRKEDQE